MSAPAIQTHEEFARRVSPLRPADYSNDALNRLPIDPDGWCSSEAGQWVHTAKCGEFSGYGYPALCELEAERDRRERKRESARTQALIADAELYRDGHYDPFNGCVDLELLARQAAAHRGADAL